MTAFRKCAVVVSPVSCNGRTAKRWPVLKRAFTEAFGEFTELVTERPGQATALARRALLDGCTLVVGVGGDGTYHEVLHGFFERDKLINPEAALAIVPEGTGSDLARTLGLPRRGRAVPLLPSGQIVPVDVGRVRYTRPDGLEETGYFLNVAHVGMGGEVVHRVNRTKKVFGGFASYLWGVIAALASYKNTFMQLEIDSVNIQGRCRDIIVANGCYDGGGMHVAPQARLDNGAFDVFVIGDAGRVECLRHIPSLYRGTLTRYAHRVRYFRAKHIGIRADTPALLNLEGEQPGQTPVTFDVMPGALRFLVPSRI